MELGFLSPVIERPGPWATVITESRYRTEDAAEQRELAARGARDRLQAQGADQPTSEVLHDALAAPPPPGEPGTRAGRALFATGGELVLDLTLAEPPHTTGEWWSPLPRLAPLLEGLGDEPPCLVAYVDRTGADLELRGDRGRQGLGTVRGKEWPVHRTGRDDWSERHFQFKVENTWEHNAGEIADAIRDCWDDSGAELLVLAGDVRERHAVHDRLAEPIRRVTTLSEHGGRAPGADSPPLDEDVAKARAAYTAERVERTVDRYRAARGGGDGGELAAEGVPALVDAAREHRIDTLLVHPEGADLGREVWVGPGPDQLAVRREELRYLGEGDPLAARADDALLRSAAATGARLVTVRGADEAPVGGLGAVLRWPEPTAHP